MQAVGLVLIALGTLGAVVVLTIDTSVAAPGAIGEPTARVENIGQLIHQLDGLIVSGVLAVSGVILYGFGALAERDKPRAARRLRARPKRDRLHATDTPAKFDEWGRPLPQPARANE